MDANGNIIADPARPGVATPWQVVNNWTAASGVKDKGMNSDDPDSYWQGDGPAPKSDTVSENDTRGYYIVGRFTRMFDERNSIYRPDGTRDNMFWSNTDESPRVFYRNQNGQPFYKFHRYGIANQRIFTDPIAMNDDSKQQYMMEDDSVGDHHTNPAYREPSGELIVRQ